MKLRYCAVVFALLLASPLPAAAQTPPPLPSGQSVMMPGAKLPTMPLQTQFLVEVNKKGQVVRSKPEKLSKVYTFNLQTFGNSQQMWIRKEDGTATVGTFRVTYDYDPKTHKVARSIALVSAGGNWGDEEGIANVMYDTTVKELQEYLKKQKEQNNSLPSLNEIRGASPKPSASPH